MKDLKTTILGVGCRAGGWFPTFVIIRPPAGDWLRVHGTQNNWLEPTVPMQKLVLKNVHRVLRY